MTELLRVTDLVAGYGKLPVLHRVSLSVSSGEIVCVLGPNGAGKSTLVKTISGLIRPFAGRVDVMGMPMAGVDPARIARLGLAQVPENRRLFPQHPVETNLRLGGWVLGRRRAEVNQRLAEVLDRFPELASRRHVLAGVLSGGQQQMLAVGMALMAKPRLMILDEPSLGLAPLVAQRVYRELAALRREGVSMLIVEQSVDRVLTIANRGLILELGRVVAEGTAAHLAQDPSLRAAYLGR